MENPYMDEKKETQRIEAFSDGVFAIAITLLILDLKPAITLALADGEASAMGSNFAANWPLFAAILSQWAIFLAYIIGFATIGIMWINHHRLFNLITRSNHMLLILNLLLLFGI